MSPKARLHLPSVSIEHPETVTRLITGVLARLARVGLGGREVPGEITFPEAVDPTRRGQGVPGRVWRAQGMGVGVAESSAGGSPNPPSTDPQTPPDWTCVFSF